MRIDWIPIKTSQYADIAALVQKEYEFRAKMTKILLDHLDDNENDLESISFDFDTRTKSFKVSAKTPEPMYSELLKIKGCYQ